MTVGEIRPAAGGRQVLDRFLPADPRDPGCDTTTEFLHAYAELASADPAAAARRPHAAVHSATAAHALKASRACSPPSRQALPGR